MDSFIDQLMRDEGPLLRPRTTSLLRRRPSALRCCGGGGGREGAPLRPSRARAARGRLLARLSDERGERLAEGVGTAQQQLALQPDRR